MSLVSTLRIHSGRFAVAAVLATGASGVTAQNKTPDLSYAARFECVGDAGGAGAGPGVVRTTVSIHNPNAIPARLRISAVETAPGGVPGAPSPSAQDLELAAEGVVSFDCADIRGMFTVSLPESVAGYLRVSSAYNSLAAATPSLDVSATYTTESGDTMATQVTSVSPRAVIPPFRPDLVASSDAFCILDPPAPMLSLTVTNRGVALSPPSVAAVRFSDGTIEVATTPELEPSAKVTLEVPFAQQCIGQGGCDYLLVADASNLVQESNETNNVVPTGCLDFRFSF